ncbi:MAG: SLBB domain-containing protein [Verrucomicrobiota bacterium]
MKPIVSLSRVALAALLAAALFSSGCQSIPARRAKNAPATLPPSFTPETVSALPALDPLLLQQPKSEYKLGPGDVLDIEIIGDLSTRVRTVVGPDGKIYFNMLPGIDVWGLTLPQVRAKMVTEMKRYVRDEQPISVTLFTAESQKVWVLGRLNKPGAYALSAPMTLLEAVSAAGGPAPASAFATRGGGSMSMVASSAATDEAGDLGRAFVLRNGQLLRVNFASLLREGDMSQNIYLQPDDFVYLPSSTVGSVHVLGAVNNPRAVEFTNRLTLVQAVAQAGGTLIRESYPSEVAIVRGSLTQPKVAIVDMLSILDGKTPDIVLEAQDIVYVPHSPYRVLTRYLDLVLTTFVRVIGINEGARAVSDQATRAGVNVPIGGL